LQRAQPLEERAALAPPHDAAEHVGVAAEVLGGGVHDQSAPSLNGDDRSEWRVLSTT